MPERGCARLVVAMLTGQSLSRAGRAGVGEGRFGFFCRLGFFFEIYASSGEYRNDPGDWIEKREENLDTSDGNTSGTFEGGLRVTMTTAISALVNLSLT